MMLWKTRDLEKLSLRATDGEIGSIDDLYFSDHRWTVRYLVVNTGGWLGGERVLVSPLAARTPNGAARTLPVDLTRERIEGAPRAITKTPVSRHFETEYHDYYGWPYYWVGGPMWGPFLTPGELARAEVKHASPDAASAASSPEQSDLRSVNEVRGYRFEGIDGALGHVEDFLVDPTTWSIVYVEIDTRDWWPGGKKTLLARDWIDEVTWMERKVKAHIGRDAVKEAPEYDEDEPVTPEYERKLLVHYGREAAHARR